jgi:hypothetical protein
MFMHACVNMTSKRIKASSRETNLKKISLMKENSEIDMDVSV